MEVFVSLALKVKKFINSEHSGEYVDIILPGEIGINSAAGVKLKPKKESDAPAEAEDVASFDPDDPMDELNEEGRAMALNYIDLLKGSEKYQAAPVRILQPVRILNLYDMPVSAGTGQFLDNDSYEEVEVGPEVPETADFGVRISGDSMMPRYLDKQIVWIQKTDELNDGEIGIFYYNGNAYCKKLLCNKKGTYLISLNDKYEPIEIAEGSTFKTFGRVVS